MPYQRLDDPEKLKSLLSATLVLEAGLDLTITLRRLVEEAVRLAGARYGALGVLDGHGTGLSRFITVGISDKEIDRIGDFPTGKGVLGLLISRPEPIRLADIRAHPSSVGFPRHHPPMGSFLGVPIRIRDIVYGNLYLTEKRGAPEFTQEDEVLVSGLAAAAGIAIENARLHEKITELAKADDRERIARDLHDTVIQRLFAMGLSLQSVTSQVSRAGLADAADRIEGIVGNLDETIRQVRTAIFSLESAPETRKGLRARILTVTGEASRALGFEPHVRFAGALDNLVGDTTATALLASLQEVLHNVDRHARASSVGVDVTIEKGEVILEVLDDGVGIAPESMDGGGMGIREVCRLAGRLGGSCVVANAPERGTLVTWRAPL